MEQNEQAQPGFSIEKVFVKDLSIEVPHAPEIFLEQASPEIQIQLQTQGRMVAEDIFEVVLTVAVNARAGEKNYFLVEVSQAGVFRLQNVPQEQVEPLLAVGCPNILFPYAREAVSDAVSRAGFPPVMLQPVNFEAMYLARLQEAQQAAGESLQ